MKSVTRIAIVDFNKIVPSRLTAIRPKHNLERFMATKFPKFSQDLAADPTTRRIWYGIATAHDFESHDGMTEENLYQKIFASH
ncbi:hypothetical protein AM228_28255, partial [Planktothricoides sp. SR001]